VQAFTIGFAEKEYDETEVAASARHFGVEHHVLTGDTDLLKLLPDVVRHYGEPSADKSVLPTMLVCELTRAHVKVALSGDGGDEAFAGYPKHRLARWQRHLPAMMPGGFRERWTLESMRGEGWQRSKAMSQLRRALLPETPSLFSGSSLRECSGSGSQLETLRKESEPFHRTCQAVLERRMKP
jgi:asparagine synthetase B (glutamine-hydrolysing)